MLNTLNHQGKQIIAALRLHLSPENKQENANWDAEKRDPFRHYWWKSAAATVSVWGFLQNRTTM